MNTANAAFFVFAQNEIPRLQAENEYLRKQIAHFKKVPFPDKSTLPEVVNALNFNFFVLAQTEIPRLQTENETLRDELVNLILSRKIAQLKRRGPQSQDDLALMYALASGMIKPT